MMSCQSLSTAAGVGGKRIAAVDAGIVDQDRDPADLLANLRGNVAALVALGHIQSETVSPAAGSGDGLDGVGRGSPLTSRTAICAPSLA